MILASRKGYIGIDIGTHAVKLAQLERQGSRLVLSECALISRRVPWQTENWLQPSPLASGDEIIAARSLGLGFAGRKSASTISMALCDIRSMSVAVADDNERYHLVESQLASIDRFGGSKRQFDFWPIDSRWQLAGDNLNVLSMSSAWANQIANDQSKAGLRCQSIDGLPLALTRAAGMMSADQEPVALVDWGYSRATFCVSVGGQCTFVRMLRGSGFGNVVIAVSEALNVSLSEARKLLCEQGVPAEDNRVDQIQSIIAEIAADAINVFAEELNRTLAFLKSQRTKAMPTKIILFGGGATLRNICPYLSKLSELPAETWNFGGLDVHAGSAGPCPLAMFGPAIALSALAWSEA